MKKIKNKNYYYYYYYYYYETSLENSEFNLAQAKELTANRTCASIATTATSGFNTLQYSLGRRIKRFLTDPRKKA